MLDTLCAYNSPPPELNRQQVHIVNTELKSQQSKTLIVYSMQRCRQLRRWAWVLAADFIFGACCRTLTIAKLVLLKPT